MFPVEYCYNMQIPEEVSSFYLHKKNKSYIVFITAFRGWGLFILKKKYLFVSKKGTMHCSNGLQTKAYEQSLVSCVFGLLKNYFQYVALLGMGYKSSAYFQNKMIFRLGYSHRSLLLIGLQFQVRYFSKQLFKIESRAVKYVKQLAFLLRKQRRLSAYKKKGICFKGEIINLKESSKKTII